MNRIRAFLLGLAVLCSLIPPRLALSQTPIEQSEGGDQGNEQQGTRLVTLGTGAGPVPRMRRAAAASMLQVGNRAYLIDAGSGVATQLAKSGVQPGEIKTIFLTHLHYDHTGGLADMIAYAWFTRRDAPIEIYGPPATSRLVQATEDYLQIPLGIFVAHMPPMKPIAAIVDAHDLDVSDAKIVYQDDKVRVTAVENTHYATIPVDRRPLGAARSYSYRFDTPGRSFVFTGDTGPSAAIEKLAKGADVLVSEVLEPSGIAAALKPLNANPDQLKSALAHMEKQHLSPENVGRLATRAGVKMVILSHVGLGNDNERDFRIYTAGVRKYFSGPVVTAKDGDEF